MQHFVRAFLTMTKMVSDDELGKKVLQDCRTNVVINVEIGSGSMNRANLVCGHLIISLVAMSEESFAAAIVS